MQLTYTFANSTRNQAQFRDINGGIHVFPLNQLYDIIPFIQIGDSGNFVQNNERIKFVLDTYEDNQIQITEGSATEILAIPSSNETQDIIIDAGASIEE